jgi:hypothetical protein
MPDRRRNPAPTDADGPSQIEDDPGQPGEVVTDEETTEGNENLGDVADVDPVIVQPGQLGGPVAIERVDLPMEPRLIYPDEAPTPGVLPQPVVAAFGRHVDHDPRSRAFAVEEKAGQSIKSVEWQRMVGPFNQGRLGSCTGNAITGLLMTVPFYVPGRMLDEATAVALYERATHIDPYRGFYPPTDTGSSGLAVCKAARMAGFISGYRHGFSVHHLKVALQDGPVIVGTEWTEGMFTPDADGVIAPTGAVAGGHEYEVLAWNEDTRFFKMVNSWGAWGPLGGYALISEENMGKLLAAKGDVTQPFVPLVA